MSFYGSSFSFNGISCEEFGYMLYDFHTTEQGASSFASGTKIHEDRVHNRIRSIYYATTEDSPLEFTLIFGANEHAANAGEPIDRQEMEIVAQWLTTLDGYKWLVIDQPDLYGIRYRCIITDLKMLEYAGNKWAFACKVHCDSPYAYTMPQTFSYQFRGEMQSVLHSRSTVNRPCYPEIELTMQDGQSCSIAIGGMQMTFNEVPHTPETFMINCETGIVSSSTGTNPYQYFNFVYPALRPGANRIVFTGNGSAKLTCSFPVNVGG